MHNSLRYRHCNEYPGRQIALTVLLLVACLYEIIPAQEVLAQSKPTGAGKSPFCTRDSALELIRQQLSLTKAFNDPVQRVAVLVRAADLLWPYEQDKARAVFTEAFELATGSEKENEPKGPRSLLQRMQIPDQRYVAITAVAKRASRSHK